MENAELENELATTMSASIGWMHRMETVVVGLIWHGVRTGL